MTKKRRHIPIIWLISTALSVLISLGLLLLLWGATHRSEPVLVKPVVVAVKPLVQAPAPMPTPAPMTDNRPMVAIVIDDMGLNARSAARAITLPAPITLAFLPYGRDLKKQTESARAAGHELLLHMPMQPISSKNPGPYALLDTLSDTEIITRLQKALASFAGYIGVNNHMGSRATADPRLMQLIMPELKQRGLMFLDSRTANNTIAYDVAREQGVPALKRDVFLDNVIDATAIREQLEFTAAIAHKKGYAIAIGHPHDETLRALEEWLPKLESTGLRAVPLSMILSR
jgi:uncharacterized protein